MTPDERQLLAGLFDRIRGASTQTRDREAESFISDAVRTQPYAPYLLAQTVIVQEQALRAANEKLQELDNKVRAYEAEQPAGGANPGFLGGLGRSIFGGGQNDQPQGRSPVPQTGGFGQQGGGYAPGGFQQGGYQGGQGGGFGGAPQGGPWAQAAQGAAPGGGFLKGALGAAAGVAGGVLLANSISGLFHGNNNPFGIASGMPGMGSGASGAGGETVINNYYDDKDSSGGGGFDNAADFSPDDGAGGDGDFGSDDGYNV